MVNIIGIEDESIAENLGIKKGDKLLKINKKKPIDFIEYLFETADDYIEIEIQHKNRDSVIYEIEKNPDENLGLVLEGIVYDNLKKCNNKCIFCFVDQQPQNLRSTLLIKDDDYRFSFLQGSFITLTNVMQKELERIEKLNLSPLKISVHTTNPDLRKKMIGNPQAENIMKLLKRLNLAGISFDTQIVLCPNINDGCELDRTLCDLISLKPGVKSIGIVPVGLTKYRSGLSKLTTFTASSAKKVIKQLKKWQNKLEKNGKNIIYLADEFYFKAGVNIPSYDKYHNFSQLENGIGLTRVLWNDFKMCALPQKVKERKHLGLITGVLGMEVLKPVIKKLNKIKNVKIDLIPVQNNFFGKNITVTGLLTGKDIINTLKNNYKKSNNIILPGIVFNDSGFTLDDKTIQDISKEFPENNFTICENINAVVEVLSNE